MAKVKVVSADAAEKKDGEFDQYEKESFHRTLMDAEMIKQDPKKMAAAMEIMQKHQKAMKGMNMDALKAHAADLEHDDMGHTAYADSETELEGPKHEKKKGDKAEDKKNKEKIS